MRSMPYALAMAGLVVGMPTAVDLAGQTLGTKAGPAEGETLSQSYRGSQSKNIEYQKIPPLTTSESRGAGGRRPAARPGARHGDRDMVIKEGDTVTFGTTSIKVYKMPGHTPGSASYEFAVFDSGKPHKAFVFGGPGQRNGVEGGTQFLASLNRIIAQFSDVEVPVHVHSWLTTYPYPNGGIFERVQKLATRKPGEPHPFVDNATWRQWLKVAQAGAVKYVEDEKAKAASRAAEPPEGTLDTAEHRGLMSKRRPSCD